MSKYKTLLLISSSLLCGSFLASCSLENDIKRQFGQSDIVVLNGVEWYDYGNGLINLSDISRITSSATVSVEAMPRDTYNNRNNWEEYQNSLDEQRMQLLIAQADFCFGRMRTKGATERNRSVLWPVANSTNSLGHFESAEGRTKLGELIGGVRTQLTPEFAEMCVLKLSGSGRLNFDDFSVNLDSPEEYLAFTANNDGKYEQSEILSQFDVVFGDLQRGKTPWDGTYGALIGR
jgi:hypothetical protein